MHLLLLTILGTVLGQVNQMMYKWGTYKPQLIHGISERNLQTFNPLTITFYYFLNNDIQWEKSIKYKVSERSQENIKYTYLMHDSEKFAIHEIIDPEYKLHLTNEFYKINPDKMEDWVTTVINNESYGGDEEYVSLVYSIAIEKLNPEKVDLRKLSIEEEGDALKITITTQSAINYIYVSVLSNGAKITLPGNKNFGYALLYQNPILNYNLRTLLYQQLKKSTQQSQQNDDKEIPYKLNQTIDAEMGNVVYVQYIGRRNEQFKFQLRYLQKELSISSDSFYDHRVLKKLDTLNFNSLFNKLLPAVQKIAPFYHSCAKSALSNLLGGFTTSYGNLSCEDPDPICSVNMMMLTPTPSRFGFPRPFLWDDGFHNMVVCRWKPQLCLQTWIDWFDSISTTGWIPREQARSSEQKSAVPQAFLAQKKSETNPPTFMFNIIYLDSLAEKNAEIQQQIRKIWPKMMDQYHFWIHSQGMTDNDRKFLFKWWGRNENINFGSGMDDWPRSFNGIKSKYNIDATMWAWFFSDSLHRLSAVYDPQRKDELHVTKEQIKKAILRYHFDTNDRLFKDILADSTFSPHLGYPNLLPLAFGFIDVRDTQTLDAQVQLMRDELWSNHGLRSLSHNDHHFGKGDNYWTGPVWIPINYLVLRGIYKYYQNHPQLMEVYRDLRDNLMTTVCGNWRDSGYFYEHYNQKLDGLGRGYHPFNGWTSTIALIINEIYD